MNNTSKTMGRRLTFMFFLVLLYTSNIQAQDIALFYNDRYSQISDGKIFAEGSNIKATLDEMEAPYSFTSDIEFKVLEKMSSDDYLIIPELEVRDLSMDISEAAAERVSEFVHNGGSMIVIGTVGVSRSEDFNCAKFLNKIFDLNLDIESFDWKIRGEGEIDQATDENWPKTLPLNNSTILFPKALPAQATSLYKAKPSGNSIALDIKIGDGSILYLGWSWWNARPVGVQDGGWSELLNFILKPACNEPSVEDLILLDRDSDGVARLERADLAAFEQDCHKKMSLQFDWFEFLCEDEGIQDVQATWSNDEGVQHELTLKVSVPKCALQLLDYKGQVVDMDGYGIEDVMAGFTNAALQSDKEGQFDLVMPESGEQLSFTLSKTDRAARLVDMIDMILLNRYLDDADTYPLSYHQQLAADVDGDRKISHADLKHMRAVLSLRQQEWPAKTNWLFIKKTEKRSLPHFLEITNEQRFTYNLSEDVELIGIKRGNLSSLDKLEGRTSENIVIEDLPLKQYEHQWVEIPIDFQEVEGVSLSFYIDPDLATIQEVDLPASLDSKSAFWSQGELLVEGVIRKSFTIRIKVEPKRNTQTSQLIESGSLVKNRVYTGHKHNYIDVKSVQLDFEQIETESAKEGIVSVYPTVVQDELYIDNQLNDKDTHVFNIYSTDGKLLGSTTVGANEKKVIKKGELVNYFGLAIVHCIDCTNNKNQKIIITQ